MSPFCGAAPIWTSGDVSSGFQSQSGQPYSHLQHITHDVQHDARHNATSKLQGKRHHHGIPSHFESLASVSF